MAGRRVLVVDDEPYILKILSFKLRLIGMLPFEATTSEEALRVVREERPDVVLLDISLPHGLTGFDLCRILKENPATSPVPIVILTARTHPSERDLGLSLGASAYMTKPFSTKALIDAIREAIGG
ncbi:MAG: response regulator [Acidobacteria bacterium]|nr:MAG: response regulator [Acidobacteriota bacterium]MCE7960091.1 response regulator [Acidobacteria bacterium ACB2]